ncbi:MAG: aminotransferase class I/II-fold pyridoxal phosphate-dependent enzyme, partial [Acidobacteriota bacterium]|nr:aminotransferase class I/II-fold pyridoxal phosphate-dependent enzyme [Acidobacteriota bacterium]
VVVPMDPGEGFTLRAEPLEKAIGPATRAVIVNSPNNPSGAVLPRDEAERLVDLVVERDLWLISDDTYESFVYDEADKGSLLDYRDRLGERLVFVSAFSKTWAMTGWRIGYAIAAKPVIAALLKIQSHDTTQACSISQKAALAALTSAAVDAPRKTIETYRARRDSFVAGLNRVPGVRCELPRGAFYAFPDVSGLMRRRGLASSAELCAALIRDKAVATVPGEAFGVGSHVRFSYATADRTLEEGLARLSAFAGSE